MTVPLRLVPIPADKYSDYRYDVIFGAYKWDPQVNDHNTIARHVVLMPHETARQLGLWAEQLAHETVLMEEAFIGRPSLARELSMPKEIYKSLPRLSGYDRSQNIRLMRFDFHPIETGWAISEVNSDVPGGLAEASALPELASQYFDGYRPHGHVGMSLVEAFRQKLCCAKEKSTIAFVHATSYSDDRQVMQCLSDCFDRHGINSIFVAPDHIRWHERKPVCILRGHEGEIDGIVRFFPLEWLANLPKSSDWKGYFDANTISCNHPVAIFAQSKRLPLVWDELGVDIPSWKQLLPDTRDPKAMTQIDEDWIYKPVFGRVGENISIREAITEKEYTRIQKAVRKRSRDWVVQKKFKSLPLTSEDGQAYHLCIGVFTVNGASAGFYARMCPYPRIDSNAIDVPILVD